MREISDSLGDIGEFLLNCAIICPLGILGYQTYIFLKDGSWPPLSVIWLLNFMEVSWARSPTDWHGLHRILDAFPLSLFSLGVFILILIFIVAVLELFSTAK